MTLSHSMAFRVLARLKAQQYQNEQVRIICSHKDCVREPCRVEFWGAAMRFTPKPARAMSAESKEVEKSVEEIDAEAAAVEKELVKPMEIADALHLLGQPDEVVPSEEKVVLAAFLRQEIESRGEKAGRTHTRALRECGAGDGGSATLAAASAEPSPRHRSRAAVLVIGCSRLPPIPPPPQPWRHFTCTCAKR